MGLTEAIILGLVQGVTEFLPISSSAHLFILPWLLGWHDPGLTFDVGLHLGTFAAVVAYFWRDWVLIVRDFAGSLFRSGLFGLRSSWRPFGGLPAMKNAAAGSAGVSPANRRGGFQTRPYAPPIGQDESGAGVPPEHTSQRPVALGRNSSLGWFVILGTIPGVMVGVLFEHEAETIFRDVRLIAVMLMLLGVVLLLAERLAQHVRGLERVSLVDSVFIGLAQAFAIIPGVSRSGSTISMGLFRGLERGAAARFSFLLGTPIILGASAKRLPAIFTGGMPSDDRLPFILGTASSAVAGFATIALLLRYLQRHSTVPFVVYRLALGVVLLGLAFWRGV